MTIEVMFPTIDLINPPIEGAAENFKREIEEFLTEDQQSWVNKKETLGLQTIVFGRAFKTIERQAAIVEVVQAKPWAQPLLVKTLLAWGLGKEFAQSDFRLPDEMAMNDALEWEFRFKKLELALADFEFNMKSQEQTMRAGDPK